MTNTEAEQLRKDMLQCNWHQTSIKEANETIDDIMALFQSHETQIKESRPAPEWYACGCLFTLDNKGNVTDQKMKCGFHITNDKQIKQDLFKKMEGLIGEYDKLGITYYTEEGTKARNYLRAELRSSLNALEEQEIGK